MACATILATDDLDHGDFVASGLEFEPEIGMAYFAGIPNTVKPVGENNGADTLGIRVIVDYNITIFRLGWFWIEESRGQEYECEAHKYSALCSGTFVPVHSVSQICQHTR